MLWRSRGAGVAVILAGVLSAGLVAQERADLATREATERYTEWLGPAPPSLTINTPRSVPSASSAMTVEVEIAYELARRWLSNADSSAINGIAWYLQSRVVERLFDFRYHLPGHSATSVWFFGRTVSRDLPALRMSRSGADRLAERAGWPDTTNALPASMNQGAHQFAMALTSLEHELGWPVVQGAILEVRRQLNSRQLSDVEVEQVISNAIGMDVSPVFAAYGANVPVDYLVTAIADHSVSVDRHGIAGPQPVTVRVEFKDGQHIDVTWDGAGARTFEFESGSPVAAAHIDPERVMLLDLNLLNNDRLTAPVTNVPVSKWVARWMLWLQDAVLTYSAAL